MTASAKASSQSKWLDCERLWAEDDLMHTLNEVQLLTNDWEDVSSYVWWWSFSYCLWNHTWCRCNWLLHLTKCFWWNAWIVRSVRSGLNMSFDELYEESWSVIWSRMWDIGDSWHWWSDSQGDRVIQAMGSVVFFVVVSRPWAAGLQSLMYD